MEKTKLRRRSKQKTLADKADKLFQNYLRAKHGKKLCEGCGERLFELGHHFVPKSQCARLRFEEKNIFLICGLCHSKIHLAGDRTIEAKIVLKRGKEWLDFINLAKREKIKADRKLYEEAIKKYATIN